MLVGVALIYVSRVDRVAPSSTDHWHAALGIYVCDKFVPDLQQPTTLLGLHTHSDGLIHVEPYADPDPSKSIGSRATLGRFIQGEPGFDVTKSSLTVSGQSAKKNGDLCGDKPGMLRVSIWPNRTANAPINYAGDPKKIHVNNGQLITIGFVPDGTKLPKPPSEPKLSDPNASETLNNGNGGAPPNNGNGGAPPNNGNGGAPPNNGNGGAPPGGPGASIPPGSIPPGSIPTPSAP